MNLVHTLLNAIGFFTRIPVPIHNISLGRTVWAWPLVGGLLGSLVGLVGLILTAFGLPTVVVSLICLSIGILLSGGLHEDGLADTFDGIWGGMNPKRRLEIMSDSQIGSYGTISLIISILFRWSLLNILIEQGLLLEGLIVTGALSRSAMVPMMMFLSPAKQDGLGFSIGGISNISIGVNFVITLLLGIFLLGTLIFIPLLLSILLAFVISLLVKKKLGGYTGDTFGFLQQLSEIGCLLGIIIGMSL